MVSSLKEINRCKFSVKDVFDFVLCIVSFASQTVEALQKYMF